MSCTTVYGNPNLKHFSSGLYLLDRQYYNNIKKTFFQKILFTHDLPMIRTSLNSFCDLRLFSQCISNFQFFQIPFLSLPICILKKNIVMVVISMQFSTLIFFISNNRNNILLYSCIILLLTIYFIILYQMDIE